MHSLEQIIAQNKRAVTQKVENAFTRHSSFLPTVRDGKLGVVLHSASKRSTGYLEGRAAKNFLKDVRATRSLVKRDELIEARF